MANRYYGNCDQCGSEVISFRAGRFECECGGKATCTFPAKNGPFAQDVSICAPELHATQNERGLLFCCWCGKLLDPHDQQPAQRGDGGTG